MNNKMIVGLVAVIVVLGLGGVLFASFSKPTPNTEAQADETMLALDVPVTSPTDTLAAESSPGAQLATEGGVKDFTVVGSNFSFDVKEIKVNQGDTVRLTFKNNDGFHDFVLDEFNAKTKQIAAGSLETIEFVADKAGTFEYYCSVGQHRKNGMVGKLIVE